MDDYLLEFSDDPAQFLAATGPLLAADPVISTVVASTRGRPGLLLLRTGGPRWLTATAVGRASPDQED